MEIDDLVKSIPASKFLSEEGTDNPSPSGGKKARQTDEASQKGKSNPTRPPNIPPTTNRSSKPPEDSQTHASSAEQGVPWQMGENQDSTKAKAAAEELVVSATANPDGIIAETIQDNPRLQHLAYLHQSNATAYETLQFSLKRAGVKKDDLVILKRCVRRYAQEFSSEPSNEPAALAEILPGLEVLGEEDGVIRLFDRTKNRYHELQRPKDLDYALLVLIAGEDVLHNVAPKYSEKDPRTPLSTVRNLIALESRRRQLRTTKTIGQGMFNIEDGRILVASGNEAASWDGSTAEYLGTPLIGSTLVELDGSRPWAGELPSLFERASSMTTKTATGVVDELVDIVGRWNFKSEHVVKVIALLILSMPVQTIWKWRPHVWITGGTDTGKSTLFKFIADLFGSLALLREARITEAGLRQEVRRDSRVILLDEFEKNEHRDAIMDLLRASNSGIELSRGTRGHKPITFGLRHTGWVGSIEVKISRAADRGRFLVAELEQFLARSTPVAMSSDEYRELRERIHAVVLWASLPALQLAEQIKTTKVDGVSGRLVECLTVPVSLLAVCSGWSEQRACEEMKNIAEAFVDASPLPASISDELDIVQAISLARIRVAETFPGKYSDGTRYVERTVAQILLEGDDASMKQLAQHGIRTTNDPDHGDEVFIYPDGVSTDLLNASRWSGLDLRTILLRLPKARYARCRVAGTRPHGVYIPRTFFEGAEDEPEGAEHEPDF